MLPDIVGDTLVGQAISSGMHLYAEFTSRFLVVLNCVQLHLCAVAFRTSFRTSFISVSTERCFV